MTRFIRILILTVLLAAIVFFGFRSSLQIDLEKLTKPGSSAEQAVETGLVAEPALKEISAEQETESNEVEPPHDQTEAPPEEAEEATAEDKKSAEDKDK